MSPAIRLVAAHDEFGECIRRRDFEPRTSERSLAGILGLDELVESCNMQSNACDSQDVWPKTLQEFAFRGGLVVSDASQKLVEGRLVGGFQLDSLVKVY